MEREEKILKEIVNLLIEKLNPERIILFGSRAKGKSQKYSDFDIAIEGADLDIRTERKVKEILDEKLGIYSIDLINLDKSDEDFKKIVYKTGKILYERGSNLLS